MWLTIVIAAGIAVSGAAYVRRFGAAPVWYVQILYIQNILIFFIAVQIS